MEAKIRMFAKIIRHYKNSWDTCHSCSASKIQDIRKTTQAFGDLFQGKVPTYRDGRVVLASRQVERGVRGRHIKFTEVSAA